MVDRACKEVSLLCTLLAIVYVMDGSIIHLLFNQVFEAQNLSDVMIFYRHIVRCLVSNAEMKELQILFLFLVFLDENLFFLLLVFDVSKSSVLTGRRMNYSILCDIDTPQGRADRENRLRLGI